MPKQTCPSKTLSTRKRGEGQRGQYWPRRRAQYAQWAGAKGRQDRKQCNQPALCCAAPQGLPQRRRTLADRAAGAEPRGPVRFGPGSERRGSAAAAELAGWGAAHCAAQARRVVTPTGDEASSFSSRCALGRALVPRARRWAGNGGADSDVDDVNDHDRLDVDGRDQLDTDTADSPCSCLVAAEVGDPSALAAAAVNSLGDDNSLRCCGSAQPTDPASESATLGLSAASRGVRASGLGA